MQPYDKHASWIKSPWNSVNFPLESSWKFLNLDLKNFFEPNDLFLAKVRESAGTWVLKSPGKSGNFAKKIRWTPCDGVNDEVDDICYVFTLMTMNK